MSGALVYVPVSAAGPGAASEIAGQPHGGGRGCRPVLDCAGEGAGVRAQPVLSDDQRTFQSSASSGVWHRSAALPALCGAALGAALGGILQRVRDARTRSKDAGTGSRNKSSEGTDQSALFVQQPE